MFVYSLYIEAVMILKKKKKSEYYFQGLNQSIHHCCWLEYDYWVLLTPAVDAKLANLESMGVSTEMAEEK